MIFPPLTFVVLATVVVAGATVQGTLGFGMNLLVAPLASIMVPEALPATLIVAAVPLTVAMVGREWGHVDWPAFGWTVLGRMPGTLAGVWLVSAFAGPTIGVAVGAIVVAATLLSIPSGLETIGPWSLLAAGCASSAMGTAAGIGGPPMALVFRNQEPQRARATISASFTVGTVVSLSGLALAGEISAEQIGGGAALWPFAVGGFLLSRRLIGRIDAAAARRGVLIVAGLSGCAAIIEAVV